jgi:thiamine kinase-like enzyme
MEDLGDSVFSEERNNMPRNLILSSLDNLARMHATFWNKAHLQDPHLGLHSSKEFLINSGRFLPQNNANQSMGAFSGWFEAFSGGWEVAEDLLSTEVFTQLHSFVETPEPFLKAIARYPFTLTHGDYKKENMAYTDRFVLFDWQLAACSLMTYDLAHYVIIGNAQDAQGEVDAVRYNRERLENHMKQRFDDMEWQAMHDLGYALFAFWGLLIFAMYYKGDENPDKRAYYKMIVQKQGQMIMDALRWL